MPHAPVTFFLLRDGSQVGLLSSAALKHVSSLDRNPGTSYRRTLAPAERTALQQDVTKKLQQFAARMQQQAEEEAIRPTISAAEVAGAAAEPPSPAAAGSPQRPKEASSGSRPGTACLPMHEMVMQRPSSRGLLSSSWGGPLSALAEQQQQQRQGQHPGSRLGTPSSGLMASRMNPMRRSMPAVDQLGRPCTAPPTPQLRPSTSSGGGIGNNNKNTAAVGTETVRRLRQTPSTLAKTSPSRGSLYSVFQDLDRTDRGRITYTELEEGVVAVGMRLEQCRKMFSMWVTPAFAVWVISGRRGCMHTPACAYRIRGSLSVYETLAPAP